MEVLHRRLSWPFLIAVSAVSAAAGFVAGYITPKDRTDEAVEASRASPIEDLFSWDDPANRPARDAARRWAEKTHQTVAEVRNGYVPVSVSTGTRDCVQLIFTDYSVGGQPSYCYRAGTLELVEEHSDVE